MRFSRVFAFFAAIATATVAVAQGGFQQATAVVPPNVDLSHVKIIQRIGNQIPMDAPFKDQTGADVTFGSLLGKRPALVLAIFYRCAGVCSVELANLVETLDTMRDKRVGRDFDVIVVGIDPIETPELANAKLAETLATSTTLKPTRAGWHFLTGTLDQIHAVTNPMGFYYTYDRDKDNVNHPAGLMFVTQTGIVSSYITGAQYKAKAISDNIEIARKGQLGIKSADIFFGCIHIDPLTGKKSIVIQNALMVLAAVTVMAIALTLLTLSGKARFRRKRAEQPEEWSDVLR